MDNSADFVDNENLAKQASSPHSSALILGDEVHYPALSANGQSYVFTRKQMEFLIALEGHKNFQVACNVVQVTVDWARSFLSSRKFKSFRSGLLMEASVRGGATINWWYQFGVNASKGCVDYYEGTCPTCTKTSQFSFYEAEQFRQDDMTMKAQCPLCYEVMPIEQKKEPFTPSREAVVCWQEIGARLIPKVERVHHEFEKADFIFQPSEAKS